MPCSEGGIFIGINIRFTIPLEPVTKKNSGRIIRAGQRYRVIPSAVYERYEHDCGYFIKGRGEMIDAPIEITCRFYMKTHRRVDLTNLLNAIDDILVHYGVISDDNSSVIVSHDGSRVYHDKDFPRTEVDIHDAHTS